MRRGMFGASLLGLGQDLSDRAVPAVLGAEGDQRGRFVLPVHLLEAVTVAHADAVRPVVDGLPLFHQVAEKELVEPLVGLADRGARAAGPTHVSPTDVDVTRSMPMVRARLAASTVAKTWLGLGSTISAADASTRCRVLDILGGLFSAVRLDAAPLPRGAGASACRLFRHMFRTASSFLVP